MNKQDIIKNCKSVVIKVGTRLLTDESKISLIISQIAYLKEKNIDVILVSSGAVGMGLKVLNLEKRPTILTEKQALAALGQSKLMSQYETEATKFNFHIGQILLTLDGLHCKERYTNIKNCIEALWKHNILPIVNENDSVATEELSVGDNDTLAAELAVMIKSDLTIILTTVDGLHSIDKNNNLDERIPIITNLNENIKSYAQETNDQAFSIGGMVSKLKAAEILMKHNSPLWIADGRDDNIIKKIMNGDDVGTLFSVNEKN